MSEINIYTTDNVIKILPKLVESIVSQNKRIYLLCNDNKEVEEIDYLLWSYSQLSFIPHATISDLYKDHQMVVIGTEIDYESKATVIISLSSIVHEKLLFFIKKYEKILLFNYHLDKCPEISHVNLIEQDITGKWIKKTYENNSNSGR